MINRAATLALVSAIAVSPAVAQAETLFTNTSLSLLYGSDYKVGEDDRVVMTLEHVSGHHWGDLFFFVDRLQAQGGDNQDSEIYGELSPRLSMSYLTGNSLSYGPIKDVYLAGTYEFDTVENGTNFDNYLYGVGLDWSVPGFNYVQTQLYYAQNDLTADDIQLTLVWGLPFEIGATAWLFDGFIDWSSAESDHAAELHFNPQLKLDVGHFFNNPGKFYVGVEYSYWHNKFGIPDSPAFDTKENLLNALVKVHW